MRINERLFPLLNAWLLVLTLSAGMLTTTAYASDGSEREPVEVVPPAAAMTDQTAPPLTPDGNLTLVDDVGSASSAGKQFVTFVTKNGNYFYLVIDRDDKGAETVHLLNLVDEADLLALLDEEDAAAYREEHTASALEPAPTPSPEPAPEPDAEPEKESPGVSPLLFLVPVLWPAAARPIIC